MTDKTMFNIIFDFIVAIVTIESVKYGIELRGAFVLGGEMLIPFLLIIFKMMVVDFLSAEELKSQQDESFDDE